VYDNKHSYVTNGGNKKFKKFKKLKKKKKKNYISHRKKYGTLHEFACHPCAGAMLIFSVSFQF